MINQFKLMRQRTALRQIDVAQKLHIKQTAVSMWETGEARPRAELLPKLAKLYGCTVDELLTGDNSGKSVL